MFAKRSAYAELETSEMEKLRIEVQQMLGEGQAFSLDAMRSMLIEVKTDNGRSETGSADSSATVGECPEEAGPRDSSGIEGNAAADKGECPRGAIPNAVRPSSEPAGEGLVPDTRARREAILRDDGFRHNGTRTSSC